MSGETYTSKQLKTFLEEGVEAYRRGDIEAALERFHLASQAKVSIVRDVALCNAALLTDNPAHKVALYQQAADHGYIYAFNMLGVLESRGFSTGASAESWFKKAISCKEAMYNLALLQTDPDKKHRYLTDTWLRFGFEPARRQLEEAGQPVPDRNTQDNWNQELQRCVDLFHQREDEEPRVLITKVDVAVGRAPGLVTLLNMRLNAAVCLACEIHEPGREDYLIAFTQDKDGVKLSEFVSRSPRTIKHRTAMGQLISTIRKDQFDAFRAEVLQAMRREQPHA